MKINKILIKWILGGILILSIIAYWINLPAKNNLIRVVSIFLSQYIPGQGTSSSMVPVSGAPRSDKSPAGAPSLAQEASNTPEQDQDLDSGSQKASPTKAPGFSPINPIRTNAQVLQAIAEQNENRDKINALLGNNAMLAAEIRQQAYASRNQTVDARNIPAPSTAPAPVDLLAKLRSNQLMHH